MALLMDPVKAFPHTGADQDRSCHLGRFQAPGGDRSGTNDQAAVPEAPEGGMFWLRWKTFFGS